DAAPGESEQFVDARDDLQTAGHGKLVGAERREAPLGVHHQQAAGGQEDGGHPLCSPLSAVVARHDRAPTADGARARLLPGAPSRARRMGPISPALPNTRTKTSSAKAVPSGLSRSRGTARPMQKRLNRPATQLPRMAPPTMSTVAPPSRQRTT